MSSPRKPGKGEIRHWRSRLAKLMAEEDGKGGTFRVGRSVLGLTRGETHIIYEGSTQLISRLNSRIEVDFDDAMRTMFKHTSKHRRRQYRSPQRGDERRLDLQMGYTRVYHNTLKEMARHPMDDMDLSDQQMRRRFAHLYHASFEDVKVVFHVGCIGGSEVPDPCTIEVHAQVADEYYAPVNSMAELAGKGINPSRHIPLRRLVNGSLIVIDWYDLVPKPEDSSTIDIYLELLHLNAIPTHIIPATSVGTVLCTISMPDRATSIRVWAPVREGGWVILSDAPGMKDLAVPEGLALYRDVPEGFAAIEETTIDDPLPYALNGDASPPPFWRILCPRCLYRTGPHLPKVFQHSCFRLGPLRIHPLPAKSWLARHLNPHSQPHRTGNRQRGQAKKPIAEGPIEAGHRAKRKAQDVSDDAASQGEKDAPPPPKRRTRQAGPCLTRKRRQKSDVQQAAVGHQRLPVVRAHAPLTKRLSRGQTAKGKKKAKIGPKSKVPAASPSPDPPQEPSTPKRTFAEVVRAHRDPLPLPLLQ
ncbi:hypothetical protein BD626DRAFT_571286 [Schizophyllum amplum]|uniref:Uncharacterized protein n=1 Tax=Schizophyllum amplum TaxID=97359 RepID=A0A550C7W8_9AGAR|nr:hypothetical protein BD626DRAFT_571286 [Auriculariopsis ampla]